MARETVDISWSYRFESLQEKSLFFGLAYGISTDEIISSFDIASHLEMKPTEWEGVKWNSQFSRIDLVAAMHGLLSSMLWMCATEVIDSPPEDKELLDSELLRYVDRISSLYPENSFHNWDHACQVVSNHDGYLSKWSHFFDRSYNV